MIIINNNHYHDNNNNYKNDNKNNNKNDNKNNNKNNDDNSRDNISNTKSADKDFYKCMNILENKHSYDAYECQHYYYC